MVVANLVFTITVLAAGLFFLYGNKVRMSGGTRFGCGVITVSSGLSCLFTILGFLTLSSEREVIYFRNAELTNSMLYVGFAIILFSWGNTWETLKTYFFRTGLQK